MALTIPDVTIVNTAYADIYAATGIPLGTPLIFQNKNATQIYLQIKATQPAASSTDGNILEAYGFYVFVPSVNTEKCWVRGNGKVAVQIFTEAV